MKKKYFIFSILLIIIIFNKAILSKVIISSLEKWIDKKITVKNVDLQYLKNEIILKDISIKNEKKFLSKNLFRAKKIKIKYKFNSIFSKLIVIERVEILSPILNLNLEIAKDNQKIEDNLGISKNLNLSKNPKIYPKKLIDINFLINLTTISNFKVNILRRGKDDISILQPKMIFRKYGNEKKYQHYKDVFRIIMSDFFLRIPDNELRKLIKKNYQLTKN